MEARTIAAKQGGWAGSLSTGNGLDALGKTRPHGTGQKAPDPFDGTYRVWHAHHLIRKNSESVESKKAQELLVEYGFDPYFGRECQVWAPNRGHTDINDIDSGQRIIDAVASGGSREQIQRRLKSTLQAIGEEFVKGTHLKR